MSKNLVAIHVIDDDIHSFICVLQFHDQQLTKSFEIKLRAYAVANFLDGNIIVNSSTTKMLCIEICEYGEEFKERFNIYVDLQDQSKVVETCFSSEHLDDAFLADSMYDDATRSKIMNAALKEILPLFLSRIDDNRLTIEEETYCDI